MATARGILCGLRIAHSSAHRRAHVWTVDSNARDPVPWRKNLHHFLQSIFRRSRRLGLTDLVGSSRWLLSVWVDGPCRLEPVGPAG